MRSRTTAATMADVARHAGVSPATVSRTLSGTRDVDPSLQARVVEAAETLGYRVNLVGRALRQRGSGTVGVIVPDLENPFFSSLAHHLAQAFTDPGLDVLVFNANSSLETERRGVLSFIGRQVKALVIIPVDETGSAANIALATDSVQTVLLDRLVAESDAHFVGVSNRRGMRLISAHVRAHVDLRRQPPIFIGAEPTSSSAHERLDGFRKWFGSDAPVLLGTFDSSWGLDAASRLLDEGFRSGTIIAAADVIAIGVMSRLHSGGFSIPADFRIIGFDGVGVARLAHPTLTTVRQPVEAMSAAIRELIEVGPSSRGKTPSVQRVTPELVVGESSPE